MNRPVRGFTLIEMLVALSIFAVTGTAATLMLGRMSDFKVRLDARSEQLAQLQRAHHRIMTDIKQLVWRPVRDEIGRAGIALTGGTSTKLLEFTRRGWRNPLQQRRSDLQRVLYRYEDGHLHRLFWRVLDRSPVAEPVRQSLISGLRDAQIIFIDDRGLTSRFWPVPERSVGAGRHLLAVRIILDTDYFGRLEWLAPVISGDENYQYAAVRQSLLSPQTFALGLPR